tara:strand:+ start:34609 stop:35190 length:582 start_codon:yes stop_codon:yes gene_type:complete
MAAVNSTMLELGTKAPHFELKDTVSGKTVSLNSFEGSRGLLVIFISNHCPYVKLIKKELSRFATDYQKKGVKVVAISSNDVQNYPDDSPEKMKEDAQNFAYNFPYLFDESQEVAKAYKAACTPDLFLFDEDLELFYRGQFDDARPGNWKTPTGKDLREAADRILNGNPPPETQTPSIGCNIKWKKGNEPEYFG